MTNTTTATGERIAGPESSEAELLDVKTVATMLGCSTRHIYRQSDAGKMPRPVKLGALVRWRADELRRWIRDGCQPVRRAKGGVR